MPMGNGQSVLVVDDEPEVLAALEEMLATLGYEPAGFRNGREALDAMRAEPRRFEAVVSDEVMPELTGTQLAVEVRKINPSLPILIASGYGGAGFETRALSAGVNRVLKKPYRMSEIAECWKDSSDQGRSQDQETPEFSSWFLAPGPGSCLLQLQDPVTAVIAPRKVVSCAGLRRQTGFFGGTFAVAPRRGPGPCG
jgi:DNA-binding NtrC family response regulator